MRNKADSKGWTEGKNGFTAEKFAGVSSSEVSGIHLGTKRQRRPSVRLEEIGDRPAAVVAEKKRRKIVFLACHSKKTPLEVNEPPGNTCNALKIRPLVNVHRDGYCHDGIGVPRDSAIPTEVAPPSPGTTVKYGHKELQTDLCDASDERSTPSHFLKILSNQGKNGNPRCGLKVSISAKNFASADGSVTGDNRPDIKDAIDMYTEEEDGAHTPEGFRDCDLETSDHFNDGKDVSNSFESKPSKNGDMSPAQGEAECRFTEQHQNGLSRFDYDFQETTKGFHALPEDSKRGLTEINEEFTMRNTEGEACAAVWTETPDKTYAEVSQNLADASMLPQATKIQSNELLESVEPLRNNTNLQFAKHHSSLLHGVREWLQNLGLGKYAQQFEAHEVDVEVLPLLTFDDLKEMGISAVGSRRKLFFAIQQLGKCWVVK